MIEFMKAHDTPNWAVFVLWALAYTHSNLASRLVRVAEEMRDEARREGCRRDHSSPVPSKPSGDGR